MDLSPKDRPLVVWAVSDGRAGIEGQVVGLAQAIARRTPADIQVKRVAWRGPLGRLPNWLKPGRALLRPESGVAPPWPDIWIAAGRATLPLSRRLRRWSAGRTFVVQVQDPRTDLAPYDLVVPPVHDGLTGENVFPILGSPHRVTAERLAAELPRFDARLASLPHPRVAVLVGGRSKAHDLPAAHAQRLAVRIAAAVREAGGSILVTFSRRTPQPAAELMAAELAGLPGWIWDGEGDNPYFAFLAAADVILATEDSTNLAVEAAAAGKPLLILPMVGGAPKFARFHQALRDAGVARPFADRLESWDTRPLDETDRAAAEVLRRYAARAT